MADERFHSQLESENESLWLPMQVLKTVQATPTLSDDVQVMIMKVYLSFEIVLMKVCQSMFMFHSV